MIRKSDALPVSHRATRVRFYNKYTVSKWSAMVKLISSAFIIMLLITVIYIFFALMLQISSKFTVRFLRLTFLKLGILKRELSNTARASSLLPKSRSISKHFTLQQDNASAHRANETTEVLSRNTPDYIAPWCGHRTHRTWIWSTTKCGVCSKNACTVPGFETLAIWSSDLSVHQWRVRLCACDRAKRGHFEHKL